MAAPLLLILLLISSAYSANKCPGDYSHRGGLNCVSKEETYRIGGANNCCPRMVLEKLKEFGIDVPVAGDNDKIAVNTAKGCTGCGPGEYCDYSTPMDQSWELPWKRLKNCFKILTCHGTLPNSEVIPCKEATECQGGFCDKQMSQRVPGSKWNGHGICCLEPKCPLSDQLIGETTLCQEDKECKAPNHCFPIEMSSYCCPVDPKYRCPDGSVPTKVENKLNHDKGTPFRCEAKREMKVKTEDGEPMCCPRIISQDYSAVINKEPVNPETTCKSNSNCRPNEFCGVSMLVNPVMQLPISHCYPTPSCIGTATITDASKGLKYCTDNSECDSDQNEVCDKVTLNLVTKGICCTFDCGSGPPEAKHGELGAAGGICTGCENERNEWSYCGIGLVNNDKQLDVCKKVEDGKYRQCTYQRISLANCPDEYDSPLRLKHSHELVPCDTNANCRIQGAAGMARCVGTGNPSGKKFCCRGDFCPDMWLWRKQEKSCTQDEECQMEGNNGKCVKTSLVGSKDPNTHCCPQAQQVNQEIIVDGPYRSNKRCTKLEDCLGENRFCDPYEGTCMYHMKTVDSFLQSDRTCTINDIQCGEKRIVCMAEGSSNQPKCYRHPIDRCDKNGQCQQGDYCAAKTKTTGKDSLRECYPAPTDAIVDKDEVGLVPCGKNKKCDQGHECHLDNTIPGVEEGFCRKKVTRQCRGLPMLTYLRGWLKPCTLNANCKNDEFCDLKATPAVGAQNEGFCCSLPMDCGGEAVRNPDAGLKICTQNENCNTGNGEICSNEFKKPADSLWQPNEGVCCKLQCPAPTPDLEMVVNPVAGPLCSTTECKNDEEKTLGLCVAAPGRKEARCCTYPRKQGLCPIDKTTGKLLLQPDNRAIQCSSANNCPDGSDCYNGVCCKLKFCPSTNISQEEQKKCSAAKDCEQPTGGSANCLNGHCCPKISNGQVSHPFAINESCKGVDDCTEKRMFCDPDKKLCTYFGADKDFVTTEKCKKKEAKCKLKDIAGVCVYADDDRTKDPQCWVNPLLGGAPIAGSTTKAGDREEGLSNSVIALIVVGIMVLVLTGAAVVAVFIFKIIDKKKMARLEAEEKKERRRKRRAKRRRKRRAERKRKKREAEELDSQEIETPPGFPAGLVPLRPQYITL